MKDNKCFIGNVINIYNIRPLASQMFTRTGGMS